MFTHITHSQQDTSLGRRYLRISTEHAEKWLASCRAILPQAFVSLHTLSPSPRAHIQALCPDPAQQFTAFEISFLHQRHEPKLHETYKYFWFLPI